MNAPAHSHAPHPALLLQPTHPYWLQVKAAKRWFGSGLLALFALMTSNVQAQSEVPIYRCGNSYLQQPCQGGKAIDSNVSVLHNSTGAPPGQSTVYLCQGYSGGKFWSATHCRDHHATMDRMETVPASLPWAQKVQQAQAQWEQAQQLGQPHRNRDQYQEAASHAAQRARSAQQKAEKQAQTSSQAAACARYRARLSDLDSLGRAGGSASHMDKIRADRHEARQQLRKLGC